MKTVLLSLSALLAAAEPTDPQDAVVAKQSVSLAASYLRSYG
jgi:ubiquitin-protein ligase